MIRKLKRHGKGLALELDRGVIDLLKLDTDTPLDVSTDGEVLIVVPVRDEERRKELEAALARANEKYGRMLKRLAN